MVKNIILTGFMATGKSAVGKRLAHILNFRFLDTDKLIEDRAGVSVAEIFKERGEGYFRQLEKDLLRELENEQGLALSTGGGMILDWENFARMRNMGSVIALTAEAEVILSRAQKGREKRPLLCVPDPLEEIKKLLKAREAAYSRADFSVDTSDKTPNEVVKIILEKIKYNSSTV